MAISSKAQHALYMFMHTLHAYFTTEQFNFKMYTIQQKLLHMCNRKPTRMLIVALLKIFPPKKSNRRWINKLDRTKQWNIMQQLKKKLQLQIKNST